MGQVSRRNLAGSYVLGSLMDPIKVSARARISSEGSTGGESTSKLIM